MKVIKMILYAISNYSDEGRLEDLPDAPRLAPTRHLARLNRSKHLSHGAELLLAADGEHHEHFLSVALSPDFVDAFIASWEIGDTTVGKAVSHVSFTIHLHANESGLLGSQ
jgi:hypothetical protein